MLDAGVAQWSEHATLNREAGVSITPTRANHVRRGKPRPPSWDELERLYLISLYQANSNKSNLVLAHACEQRFGRTISENAIRGALYRLRLHGRITLREGRKTWFKRRPTHDEFAEVVYEVSDIYY